MGRWKRRRRPPGGSADRGGAAPLPAGLGGAAAPEERCASWTARRGAGRPAARARGLAPPVRPVGSGTPAARHGRPVLRRLTAAAPQRGSTCRRLPGLSRSLGRCGSAQRCAAPPPPPWPVGVPAVSPRTVCGVCCSLDRRGSSGPRTGVRAVVQLEFGKASVDRVCAADAPARVSEAEPKYYLKLELAVFPSLCKSQGGETRTGLMCAALRICSCGFSQ